MNDLARLLVEHTAVVTAAVLAIAVLRRPLRKLFGAEAAYWLWLVVPFAHLAVALPARVVYVDVVSAPVAAAAASEVTALLGNAASGTARIDFAAAAMIVWLCGALLMVVLLFRRHRKALRALCLTVGPDGSRRSAALRGPAVLGVFRPAIVLPADFEERYGPQERALMLAHERAHVARRDLLVDVLAAAWACVFWFHPLVHWAYGRLRFDQDLACDGVVMRSAGGEKRRYAAALLATQLAADEPGPSPAACHWQSTQMP